MTWTVLAKVYFYDMDRPKVYFYDMDRPKVYFYDMDRPKVYFNVSFSFQPSFFSQ